MRIYNWRITLKALSIYFLSMVLTWMIAFFFLLVFQIENSTAFPNYLTEHLQMILWSGSISGVTWGVIFKVRQSVKKYIPSYFLNISVSLVMNIFGAYTLLYCMFHIESFFTMKEFPRTYLQLIAFYSSPMFYVILIYFFIVGILIEIFYDVDSKLGKGVFVKLLLGRYFKPKEVERIFLFMDLKSSTHYAEKLGHFKYSRLIQDCFKDLTCAVKKNRAEIYQYVGDEAVLIWKVKQGLKENRCLKLFFDFRKTIESRKNYYQKEYGMLPIFKAGAHIGKVMLAEVGELKSEIAYHGDAINTAARIQAQCNSYRSKLLISIDLLEKLDNDNGELDGFINLKPVLLSGKEIPVEIYAYKEKKQASNGSDYEIGEYMNAWLN